MRMLMKLVAAPILFILTLIVWICMGLLYCSSFFWGLAGTLLGLFGVGVLLTTSVPQGIAILVMAFLVSPLGLPMAAAWLLSKLMELKYSIQEKVYG